MQKRDMKIWLLFTIFIFCSCQNITLEKIRSGDVFKEKSEQTRQNMVMFEKALSMFTPFRNVDGKAVAVDELGKETDEPNKTKQKSEIEVLKEQLSDMQDKLEKIAKKTG